MGHEGPWQNEYIWCAGPSCQTTMREAKSHANSFFTVLFQGIDPNSNLVCNGIQILVYCIKVRSTSPTSLPKGYSTSSFGTELWHWLPTGVRFGKPLANRYSTMKQRLSVCLSVCPLQISGTFIRSTSHFASVLWRTQETTVPIVKLFGWEMLRDIKKRKHFGSHKYRHKNLCFIGLLADCNLSNIAITQTHSCNKKLPVTFHFFSHQPFIWWTSHFVGIFFLRTKESAVYSVKFFGHATRLRAS